MTCSGKHALNNMLSLEWIVAAPLSALNFPFPSRVTAVDAWIDLRMAFLSQLRALSCHRGQGWE